MREIKFRAWDKKSKKMRIIDSIAFHGLGHFDIPTLDIKLINLWGYDIIEDKYFIIRRDPEQVKLLQFTGLYDKNGKEIYEGDIYHQGDPQITYTVVWHDTGLIGKQNGSSSYAGLSHWESRIEIIGNIYEHPHLLEGEK